MIIYAMFVTLLFGIMLGIIGTVAVACRMEERQQEKSLAVLRHPANGVARLLPNGSKQSGPTSVV